MHAAAARQLHSRPLPLQPRTRAARPGPLARAARRRQPMAPARAAPGDPQAAAAGAAPPAARVLTGDQNWVDLWRCFRMGGKEDRDLALRKGFLGYNYTINPAQAGEGASTRGWLPEPKVWFRAFNVPEDDADVVLHTNVKEQGGETTVSRADGLIEARWEFTKEAHNDEMGFHHPNAQPMSMIALTDTVAVGLPLRVLGWPERAALPANTPPGAIQDDPASVYSWWCETFFIAGQPEQHGAGGADGSLARTSIGVVYRALPEAGMMVRSNIWEPLLVQMRVNEEEPLDLRGMLEGCGKVPAPALTSDPSTWLSWLHSGSGSEASSPSKPVQLLAKQVCVDHAGGRLLQSSASCALDWQQQSGSSSSSSSGGSHNSGHASPALQGGAALGGVWSGSVVEVQAPPGYHVFTYGDGAYMICTPRLSDTLVQASSGAPNAWVTEAGVMGFWKPGRWVRVRTFLDGEGRVARWEVLEYVAA